ncbi:MAG TPA: tetratricopeptide repeat protein, partial [Polyangiaceae bacterium]
MSLVSRLALVLFLAASCFVAGPAGAQGVDDATRAAARSLGYEGVQDFQAGSYPAAADKLDRAYRALKVPSLGLWSARAFEKIGKLVEASERLLEVQRLDASGGDVSVQKQAQADAATDQAAIAPRIPSVVILIEGATADQARVTVNGSPVPASLIGLKRQVNPGSVKVDGVSGGATATQSVTLKEGESKTVTLRFAAGTAAAPAAAAVSTPAPAP